MHIIRQRRYTHTHARAHMQILVRIQIQIHLQILRWSPNCIYMALATCVSFHVYATFSYIYVGV